MAARFPIRPAPAAGVAAMAFVVALAARAGAAAVAGGAATDAARSHAVCPVVDVSLLETVDSRHARAGDRFAFETLYPVTVDGEHVPRGARGAGFVATVVRARHSGRPGSLVLDARYLSLPDGRHLAAAFAPVTGGASPGSVAAPNTDAPGVLGYTPLVAVTSVYNLFHHGKEAALVRGTVVPVVLGDGLAAGTCAPAWVE